MMNKSLHEVCAETGATRRAVQGYEKAGLVAAIGKNKYGHLLYDAAALERIRTIRFLQQIGFSIREIQLLIDAPAAQRKRALCRQAELLRARRREIAALLDQLERWIAAL